MKRFTPILMTGILLILAACNPYKQDSYVQQYVVQAYLVAGRNLPTIYLSHTVPAAQQYTFASAAVSNARISVAQLDDNGQPVRTIGYTMAGSGVYRPLDSLKVLPLTRYRMQASVPGEAGPIEAQTIVPDTFRIINRPPQNIIYQAQEAIEFTSTRSYYPGRQNIYIFSVISDQPTDSTLTPFYADVINNGNNGDTIDDFVINSSGIVNEGNFTLHSDGTLSVKFPWIGVAFYGPNDLVMNALDDNIYDFLRSQSVQTGGGTLPPGQIQNAISHVTGGIGFFGSLSSDTVRTNIERNPGL